MVSKGEGDRRNFQLSNRSERCTIVVEMLAWCGAALSCLLSVPQAVKVVYAERLELVTIQPTPTGGPIHRPSSPR